VRIGVLSDLYIDKLGSPPIPEILPDILVLAGNIGCGSKGIEWAAKTYACPIVYVLGNYAYRGHNLEAFDEELRHTAWGSNLHLLQNQTIFVRGVRFIGTTLWTDFALFGDAVSGMVAAENLCEDFKSIRTGEGRPVTPADTIALHRRAVEYLWRTAAAPYDDGHTVVVTHHAPSLRSIPAGFRDDRMASCFASNLDELVFDSDAMFWVHAGVYGPVDYELGDTRVVANPRGIPTGDGLRGVEGFRADYTLEM
jgi:hypothetical protein